VAAICRAICRKRSPLRRLSRGRVMVSARFLAAV